MKFICEREKLLKAINSVVKGVASKTTMPILEGILIQTNDNEIKLTTYDLELGIEYRIETEVIEEGEIIINLEPNTKELVDKVNSKRGNQER